MHMKKDNFFAKMIHSEHRAFEISMFSISVILSLVLVIGIGFYASTFFGNNTITDEEANASSVTDSATTVREQPEPTSTPDGDMMVNEDDVGANIDENLASATEGYTTTSVNMRAEPSLTATIVMKVPMNTKLTFIKLHDGEWMEVDYNGKKGYINAMYLSTEISKPIATVTPRPTTAPSKKPRTTATPKPKKTPKPTKKPKATKKPTPIPTQVVTTPAPTPTKAPTEVPTEEPVSDTPTPSSDSSSAQTE